MAARLEKILVGLLLACFTLPLSLGLILRLTHIRHPLTRWLRNATLNGIQTTPEPVVFSRENVISGRSQSAVAGNFDLQFAGREFLIRTADEVYLRAFHMAPSGILVGPNFSLIESAYCEEYCLIREKPDALAPLVSDLRRLQDFCAARGIAFALLITPSKASIYPENLPADWLRRYDPAPRDYDNFVGLLRAYGVHFVDGHRITADLKRAGGNSPVFPLGGVHWTAPAALATTNALLTVLAAQGLRAGPISQSRTSEVIRQAAGQDNDLAGLLNTAFPLPNPVPVVRVEPVPVPDPTRPNMVLVGGSFVWKPLAFLDASGQFSELEYYNYYKLAKFCQVGGLPHRIAEPTPPLDFDTDVFAADALVLELNEQALPNPDHVAAFLRDALAVLPDPHAGKAPFHYESRMSYRWGDTINFLTGNGPVNMATTTGFLDPSHLGAYTTGPLASIHFTAPPPPEDMVLTVNAGAFLVNRRVPEQRVGVYANGHFVGEWVWTQREVATRELTIPRDFLTGGEVRLEFHISRPSAPVDDGVNGDAQSLGILVDNMRLHAAGE